MKKWHLLALASVSSVFALGQSVPRAPVIRVRQETSPPTPTPLPDPSGVYSGGVALNVSGTPGTFNQTWRIDLQSRSCPECVPGQYYVYGTNFNATSYTNGAIERGGVYGSVNPNGDAFDLNLFAINCPFVNPSGNLVSGATYSGNTWGGNFGESLGVPLVIRDGTMSGRISGRSCFGNLITADVSLQRQPTSVPPACNSIAGNYNGSFANSCGGSGSGAVTIRQTGCDFGASLAAIGAGVEGTITGPTSGQIRINDACATAVYTGSMTINGGTITGTYSGFSTGAFGCCPAGVVSGSFALTKS